MTSLTSGERLREDLCGEGGLGARACRAALLVLVLAQHVPPAAVQEAVEDVRGDDVRQRGRRLRLKGRLQAQRRAGQDGAHVGDPSGREPGAEGPGAEGPGAEGPGAGGPRQTWTLTAKLEKFWGRTKRLRGLVKTLDMKV